MSAGREARRGELPLLRGPGARGRRDGLSLPAREHVNYTLRQPIGPVAAITPWNTPFMLSTWKIAPALAAGCTVVHKPAEWSPITATLLAETCAAAGLPAGVLNCRARLRRDGRQGRSRSIPRSAPSRSSASPRPAAAIMKQGAPTLKRVHFELGGKNPVIVFEDADLERALDAVVFMIYSLNGERCTSSSRLLVQRSIDEGIHGAPRRARAQDQGGSSARSRDRDRPADSRAARREGARLFRHREGRERRDRRSAARRPPPAGNYVQPTLFAGAHEFHARRSGRDLRPGAHGDSVRRRGRGAADRERRALRPRGATSGRATSAARTASRARSRPAWCG